MRCLLCNHALNLKLSFRFLSVITRSFASGFEFHIFSFVVYYFFVTYAIFYNNTQYDTKMLPVSILQFITSNYVIV